MTTDPEYRFVLTDKTSIIFHNNDVEAADRLKKWQKDPKNKSVSRAGDDRTPPWTWQHRLHHDGEHVAIPQDVIMRMLGAAAAKMPTGKRQETFKSMSQSSMFLNGEWCKFTTEGRQVKIADIRAMHDDPFSHQAEQVKELGFTLLVKPVAVERKRHIRVRPKFSRWEVEGVITVTEPAITFDILTQMFTIGGKYCGLLEWRPNAPKFPGPYGMFTAELTPLHAGKRKTT